LRERVIGSGPDNYFQKTMSPVEARRARYWNILVALDL